MNPDKPHGALKPDIALLSGNSLAAPEGSDPVRIQLEDFSQDEEIAALKATSNRMGGIGIFLGCARDFSEGREVSQLSFEAYGSMALSEMNQLRNEAIEKFGLLDARIVHRIGTIKSGDNIVLIAAGAEHRVAALDACRWLIDELKQRVPIWKKEISPQGDSWVVAHP
jgi:molybdopterin synthase catalytic subunit